MYFFIILCLYWQVCIEFFLGVFGLVLVLEYLHSHVRRPPPRQPPHHHLLGYHGAAVRPSCGNNSVCATDLAPRAARSSWRSLTFDSSMLICFYSACTSDATCWLRRPPVRRRALRESTTSRSALIVLALSESLHRSNIIFDRSTSHKFLPPFHQRQQRVEN